MGKELFWGTLGLLVVILTCLYTVILVGELPDRGTFGDMFGAANALFSGLALTGLIVTLVVQQKEFRLQRESLNNSNYELDAQKRLMARSGFDTTFFKMVELHERNVREMSGAVNERIEQTGQLEVSNFEYVLGQFRLLFDVERHQNDRTGLETIAHTYNRVYKDHGYLVSYYFRSLCNLVDFCLNSQLALEMRDTSDKDDDAIKPYMKIIRSLFTPEQRHLLFLNTLAHKYSESPSGKKLNDFIENYRLLKHLNSDAVAYLKQHLTEEEIVELDRIVVG